MTFSALTPQFAVSPQLAPQDLEQAVAQGFKTVINNRPDFEGGPDQPTSAQMKAAAEALGLAYAYLPVQGGFQSAEEIAAFRELLDALPGPVLAFCRSGARCTKLFVQAQSL